MDIHFKAQGANALAHCKYDPVVVNILKLIPGYRKWEPKLKAWKFKPTRAAMEYLQRNFPNAVWDDKLQARIKELEAKKQAPAKTDLIPFKFKTPPYEHQHKAFSLAAEKSAFAWFMDMGTGKSKVAIDDIAYQYVNGRIMAAVVVCPNSIKSNWLEELAKHMPEYVDYRAAVWDSSPRKAEQQALDALCEPGDFLRVLVVNVEAFSHKRSTEYVAKFVNALPCLIAVDESSRIKKSGATRTRNLTRIGKQAKIKRIMTGTPVTQSPMDVFSQFTFLDEDILGFDSYYSFRNRYAVMGGWENKEVTGFQNLTELQDNVDAFSFRVTKEECLDLPDKVYERRVVDMTPEQAKAYKQMKEAMIAEVGDGEVSAKIPLTRLLRFQQITGGFVPLDEEPNKFVPIPGTNPKIAELLSILEETQGKVIIWAMFRSEIEAIANAIRAEWRPEQVVEFHGGVKQDERTKARLEFQDGMSDVQFFVGQPSSGGIGITLTEANTVIYFSNSFSLEDRLQSEDRAHRIGQDHKVLYIDLVMRNTIDSKLLRKLRSKREIASLITHDELSEWI